MCLMTGWQMMGVWLGVLCRETHGELIGEVGTYDESITLDEMCHGSWSGWNCS